MKESFGDAVFSLASAHVAMQQACEMPESRQKTTFLKDAVSEILKVRADKGADL